MKKVCMWVALAVAMGLWLAANGLAQQSTLQPVADYTPAAPGTTSAGPAAQQIPAPAEGLDSSDAQFRTGQGMIEGIQPGELGVGLATSGGAGVVIRRITNGSAADMAGLEAGDVILEVNGQGASSPHGVAQMIREVPAGETVFIEYWRNGQTDEMQIVLQPSGEPYRVGYRGDESSIATNRTSSDLETRTMRLEEQLNLVMQELRQLRQEMAQLRSSGQPVAESTGFGGPTTNAKFDGFVQPATSTTEAEAPAATTQPVGAPPAETTTTGDPFVDTPEPATTVEPTTEPAADPAPAPVAVPVSEPAADDESDDLFDGSTTEEPATAETASPTAEATPADDEAAAEAPAAEAESKDLFE